MCLVVCTTPANVGNICKTDKNCHKETEAPSQVFDNVTVDNYKTLLAVEAVPRRRAPAAAVRTPRRVQSRVPRLERRRRRRWGGLRVTLKDAHRSAMYRDQ
jgi:hypothetical protein